MPRKVILYNGSELKRNFIPFLKYFYVKPKCASTKKPQANAILERIHQVVGGILKTKYIDNVTFDAVTPWNYIIASITHALKW